MIGLAVAIRNARLNAIRDAMDADENPARLRIYTAPRPVTGGMLTDQTLLVALTFSQPSAPDAEGGELVFDAIEPAMSTGAGVPVWGRLVDGAGAFVADLSVGEVGSGADIQLNAATIEAATVVTTVGAQRLTEGNG